MLGSPSSASTNLLPFPCWQLRSASPIPTCLSKSQWEAQPVSLIPTWMSSCQFVSSLDGAKIEILLSPPLLFLIFSRPAASQPISLACISASCPPCSWAGQPGLHPHWLPVTDPSSHYAAHAELISSSASANVLCYVCVHPKSSTDLLPECWDGTTCSSPLCLSLPPGKRC